MKVKKIGWIVDIVILVVSVAIAYYFKPMTMKDVHKEPHFAGIVTEVNEKTILVAVNEDEEAYRSSDRISVSLDVKLKDSMTHFQVGDSVKVYYDGSIAESYPAQVNTVYAILLTESRGNKEESEVATDLPPMVRTNGNLYYDTGKESDITARCGVMDGEITSTVKAGEVPTQDNQSNFGKGYGYQFVEEDKIDVYMNEKWMRFEMK